MEKTISVNGTDYEIVELLGRGKGGYSYLASSCDRLAVLKQIHHEPCDFYTFGNKLESEKNAYSLLSWIYNTGDSRKFRSAAVSDISQKL